MTLISNDLTSPMIERFLTSYDGVLYSYHALLPLARLGDGCSLPCTLALNNALSWWKAWVCGIVTSNFASKPRGDDFISILFIDSHSICSNTTEHVPAEY